MLVRCTNRPTRRGFSLVELLVAMALIVFLMAIIGEGFSQAGKLFSQMKAIGDLSERLRGVQTLLRRDLASPHFDTSGSKRLGDGSVWQNGAVVGPPDQGFFRLYQIGMPIPYPGPNSDPPTFTTTQTSLHFTVALPKRYPENVFTTRVPANYPTLAPPGVLPEDLERRYQPLAGPLPIPNLNTNNLFRSEWAEVSYWLVWTGDFTDGSSGTQKLYTLRRRQRLLWWGSRIPDTLDGTPTDVSVRPVGGNWRLNLPGEITIPAFRFATAPTDAGYSTTPPDTTEDIIAHNVLSFDVQVLPEGGTDFVDLSALQAYNMGNPSYPAAGPVYCFDTWSRANIVAETIDYLTPDPAGTERWAQPGQPYTIPLFRNAAGTTIKIRAIQITLRIWDSKSTQTRQSTMIQDL